MRKICALLIAAVLAAGLNGCRLLESPNEYDPGTRQTGFETDLLPVTDGHGRYGYIDRSGTIMIKPQFQDARYFFGGLAAVKKGGKWGYIDKTGSKVVDFRYYRAYGFVAGHAMVMTRTWNPKETTEHYGFIDRSGNEVIKPIYEEYLPAGEGLFELVDKDTDTSWLVDESTLSLQKKEYGKELPKFRIAGSFSEGRQLVRNDDGYGFADETGELVIPCQFYDARYFYEGLAAVRPKLPGGWEFISADGSVAITGLYDEVGDFSEGLAWVREDGSGKLDFIDNTGKVRFSVKGASAGKMTDGVCPVDNETVGRAPFGGPIPIQNWGAVDSSGKTVLEFKYSYIISLGGGLLRVDGGKDDDFVFGYCDTSGKFIWKDKKK